MTQIHQQFRSEQIKVLLQAYEAGHLSRDEIERTLGIGKTRFFTLLRQYREDRERFSIQYERTRPRRLSAEAEAKIRTELPREKELVENKDLPISGYNYAALNDRLKQPGIKGSTTTLIQQDCYLPKKRKTERHDCEVLTSTSGDLIQHDASLHKWSPFAAEKWTLDDYSRMLRYAEFVETETSWAHLQAVPYRMQQLGIPHRYDVNNLRGGRFVQHRDSLWKNLVLGTDEVNTQWRQVLALLKTDVIYALSPQAKGKIEQPDRWLQDRIVRTWALEHISTPDEARPILRKEVHRYNYHQVLSTTGEILAVRFEKAPNEHPSLFRPFVLPNPFSSPIDIFCLRHPQTAVGYRKIAIAGHLLQIPGIEPRDDVELHLVPNVTKNLVEIRIWAPDRLAHTVHLPIATLQKTVHF